MSNFIPKLVELDLGKNPNKLLKGLEKNEKLKKLKLFYPKVDAGLVLEQIKTKFPNIDTIEVSNYSGVILSVEELGNMPNLKKLKITKCPRLLGITHLDKIPNIVELDLSDNPKLVVLDQLNVLNKLVHLNLEDCPFYQTASELNSEFPKNLKTLNLKNNKSLFKFEEKGLKNLEELNVSKCSFESFNGEGLKSLKTLNLHDNPNLEKISGGMKKLESLILSQDPKHMKLVKKYSTNPENYKNDKMNDYTPLYGCKKLEHLDLSDRGLTSIPSKLFDNFTKLKRIYLSGNDFNLDNELSKNKLPQGLSVYDRNAVAHSKKNKEEHAEGGSLENLRKKKSSQSSRKDLTSSRKVG